MIARQSRAMFSPIITRHFESTRIQNQLIASAYHILIPVVTRPLGRSRPRGGENEQTAASNQDLRTKARGA
jgi:hypothetical protein